MYGAGSSVTNVVISEGDLSAAVNAAHTRLRPPVVPYWVRRRERVVELLQAASDYESERAAVNDFRAWAEAEGLLDREN